MKAKVKRQTATRKAKGKSKKAKGKKLRLKEARPSSSTIDDEGRADFYLLHFCLLPFYFCLKVPAGAARPCRACG
jgi:hypothetical protein